MSETEPLPYFPPNEINSYGLFPIYLPSAREAAILQIAEDEGLPCPQCVCDLYAEKRVYPPYVGVMVECIECGFREM